MEGAPPPPPPPASSSKPPPTSRELKKPGARRRSQSPPQTNLDPNAPHLVELPAVAEITEAFTPLPTNLDAFLECWHKLHAPERHPGVRPSDLRPALQYYFTEHCTDEARNRFFTVDLPVMVSHAAKLPELLPTPLARLRSGERRTIELTREAVASILCCAFFCVWPAPPTNRYPDINFTILIRSLVKSPERAKFDMFLNYFRRIAIKMPTGKIRITRKVLGEAPDWSRSTAELSDLEICETGVIEERQNALQIDFANKYIGGGVICGGCVQEEIRFSINPDCVVTLLLCEVMENEESVMISGSECFSKYAGYAGRLSYDGDYVDTTPVVDGVIQTHIAAIDALDLRWLGAKNQYNEQLFLRELNKAYIGFSKIPGDDLAEVATGNWGCGAFLGDKELKSVLQWMAASQAGRKLVYYTFGEAKFAARLRDFAALLAQRKPILSEVYHAAMGYPSALQERDIEFFDYMSEKFSGEASSSSSGWWCKTS